MLKTALFTTLVTAFVVAPALAQGHGGGRSKTSHGPQVATTAAGAAATAPKGSTHGSPHTISTTTTHGSPKATAPTMKTQTHGGPKAAAPTTKTQTHGRPQTTTTTSKSAGHG